MNYPIGTRVRVRSNHWLVAGCSGVVTEVANSHSDGSLRINKFCVQLDDTPRTIWLSPTDFTKDTDT